MVTEPEEYFKIIRDQDNVVSTVTLHGEDVIGISYKKTEEAEEPLQIGNVALACFVTSYARLKLYSYLEKLRERVLYFDTGKFFFSRNFYKNFLKPVIFRLCHLHLPA